MEEELVFEQINELLEECRYPLEIKSINDLEDFLSDSKNLKLEVYDDIVGIYENLMEDN